MKPKVITTIIRKEWAELYKNPLVLSTVLFMPLLFTALPLIVIFVSGGMGGSTEAALSQMPPQMAGLCQGLSGGECGQVFVASQFIVLFLMVPLMIPATIAPFSIVGEKTQRSLEPLLATPISTAELLTGKNLAATVPAVLATWLAFGLFALGAWLMLSDLAFARLMDPAWLAGVFVVGPLLAILSVNFAIMVSARSNDPRVAQQVSALLVLPIVFVLIAQLAGILIISPGLILLVLVALVILDIVLTYVAVQVFQRETILTRWK